MIHDYKGLPKTSRAGANVAVWLLCLQTVCYADCGAYQAFQKNTSRKVQELGFQRSHNGGWTDTAPLSNPKARLLECKTKGSYRLPKAVVPGVIEPKCRWSVHKCLWHCRATSDCLAFEFGKGTTAGDPVCRYYNRIGEPTAFIAETTATTTTDANTTASNDTHSGEVGTRISDPAVIYESYTRCKKGYTQVASACGTKPLQDRDGNDMVLASVTFEECHGACVKQNKDGFKYGCKSFDFSKGFSPAQGPDSCDYTDNLFEGLPCSFETILSDSTQKTCLEYCNEEKPGTSCVRSWLQEIVADFGKNNCNQTYEQDANVVCVCANVGSCTLYADADISTEAVTGDTVSTHFRMDKPTALPANLPVNVTIEHLRTELKEATLSAALSTFSIYSTNNLTCDDGGLVDLYDGGKLKLYDCARACKRTPGCFVFKYEERAIDGVIYPTMCKWQQTLLWNECVHKRKLSAYSLLQESNNAIYSGLYQLAEDPDYNTGACKGLPGMYVIPNVSTDDICSAKQSCRLEDGKLTGASLEIFDSTIVSHECTQNNASIIEINASDRCSVRCMNGTFREHQEVVDDETFLFLNCRPGPSNETDGHLNTARISCREQTCVVDSAKLENMHTTAASESCVEISSYVNGSVVKNIILEAKKNDDDTWLGQCKMKCDTGYYSPPKNLEYADPILTCAANSNRTNSTGNANTGELECKPKVCIIDESTYKDNFPYVDFEDCYSNSVFDTLRDNYADQLRDGKNGKDIILQAVGEFTSCNLGCFGDRVKNESADTTLTCLPLSSSPNRGTTNEDGIRYFCVVEQDADAMPPPHTVLGFPMSVLLIIILITLTVVVLMIIFLIACIMDRISYRRVKKHIKED